MSSEGYSIHIIEGDDAVRRALALLTVAEGFEAFTYCTAAEYLERRRREGSGCILLDLRLPGTEGMDLLKRLGLDSHRLPVIVMSVDGDAGLAMRALATGATAFLEKPFGAKTLFSAIAAAREEHAPPPVPEAVAEAARQIAALSPREREVLAALAAGRQQKEIALSLGISVRTVEVHRARMLRRLGLARVAAAVRLYVLADLATDPDRTSARSAANRRPRPV
jgi:two-component system, LuxR family, response regulator FixJ